jgi:hypothetical protein
MREDQVRTFIQSNLSKIVESCAGACYPFPFKSEIGAHKEFSLDLPIIGHQLACTEAAQILSYMVMELNSFVTLSAKMFPKLPRNEGVKLLVSANNEILNTITSKLASILAKSEGKGSAVITPPVVMNYAGTNRMGLNCADSLFLHCQSSDFSFRFITTFQMV